MDDDFLKPPRRMAKEYIQHGLLLLLDVIFMLFWLGAQALYHVASEWIIEKVGFGAVDRVAKALFDVAFAGTTFVWVVATVWRVHYDAYAHGRQPPQHPG